MDRVKAGMTIFTIAPKITVFSSFLYRSTYRLYFDARTFSEQIPSKEHWKNDDNIELLYI